jgi:hypothetical protein
MPKRLRLRKGLTRGAFELRSSPQRAFALSRVVPWKKERVTRLFAA